MTKLNRYAQLIEEVFRLHYRKGAEDVAFDREDLTRVAERLGIKLPKNLGDIIYSFRYRVPFPESILRTAPEGKEWIIRPAGTGKYRFVAVQESRILPNPMLVETKIPDATPGVISRYSLTDEQALLARLRYNRLIDIFTGVACYSLQSHLRTNIPGLGQVETDELYIGVDSRGAQYVIPIQAKGGKDQLSVVQIEQDFALCAAKFASLICRPIAAQFMANEVIALFDFKLETEGVKLLSERHYRLVPAEEMTEEDLQAYRSR